MSLWSVPVIAMTIALLTIFFVRRNRRWRRLTALIPSFRFTTASSTVIAASALVLLAVIAAVAAARPGRSALKKQAILLEIDLYQAMGRHLGAKFSRTSQPDTNVLIVNRPIGAIGEQLHQGFVDGFNAGIIKNIDDVKDVQLPLPSGAANAATIMSDISMTGSEFDEIVKSNGSPGLIISLVGLPRDYDASNTRIQASQGELQIAVLTDSTYELGEMIYNREIAACIIPKRIYAYRTERTEPVDYAQLFDDHFYDLDGDNIVKILRRDRRMFKASKAY